MTENYPMLSAFLFNRNDVLQFTFYSKYTFLFGTCQKLWPKVLRGSNSVERHNWPMWTAFLGAGCLSCSYSVSAATAQNEACEGYDQCTTDGKFIRTHVSCDFPAGFKQTLSVTQQKSSLRYCTRQILNFEPLQIFSRYAGFLKWWYPKPSSILHPDSPWNKFHIKFINHLFWGYSIYNIIPYFHTIVPIFSGIPGNIYHNITIFI